ncbi:type IV pilin protein [Alishewanella sp. d11]|uniref:type IV pilin protein n=1 Tax=Alishewanella sp. d11 TaxID=3414030 RepID=UPI003BF7D4F4
MSKQGFSLLEMLIVVLLLGILTAIAYPAYQQYVLRSYRAEAVTTMLTIASRQEQLLADFAEYSADLVKLGLSGGATPSGRYRLQIQLQEHNQAYRLLMIAQGPQQQDSKCRHYSLNHLGQRNVDITEPISCWQ